MRFSSWDEIAPNTVIMKDGEHGDFFCFVFDGEVRVIKRGHTLSQLSIGDCFGEMAIIGKNSQIRGADVVAQTNAKIITVRADALRNASEACRMHFYLAFLEVLANRLNDANIRLTSI